MDGSRTSAVDYGSEEAAMQAYLREGETRAARLGNRGPIRFTSAGELHPDIVEAYWRCGFYVFEGVLKQAELGDIEHDLHGILDRLPDQRHPLFQGEERLLRDVHRHGDDHAIGEALGAADQVLVPARDRVERAGVNGDAGRGGRRHHGA